MKNLQYDSTYMDERLHSNNKWFVVKVNLLLLHVVSSSKKKYEPMINRKNANIRILIKINE